MTHIPYLTPTVRAFDDRSTRLLVMGILLIIGGAISGCLGLAMPMTMMMPRPAGTAAPRAVDIIFGTGVYVLIAALAITLGIGSIRKRRWVRPIVLVLGWIGLAAGVLTLVTMLFLLPGMMQTMQTQMATVAASRPPGRPPIPAFAAGVAVGAAVVISLMYIAIPLVMIWMFKGKDVQATLEFYDPAERWTDGRPIPVLALSALALLSAFWALMMLVQGWTLLFGMILSGAPARLVCGVIAALFALAAVWVYRLRPAGWWITVLLFVILSAGWILAVMLHSPEEIYANMGLTDQQLQMVRGMNVMNTKMMAGWFAASAGGAIGLALGVKKHFVKAPVS